MQNQITQVHNTSSEDLKNEIVTDVVAKMKKELQFFTEKLTPDSSPEFIDSKEVCKMLQITPPTLYDWRKKGIVPAYRIANKIRFDRSEIENSLTKIEG